MDSPIEEDHRVFFFWGGGALKWGKRRMDTTQIYIVWKTRVGSGS